MPVKAQNPALTMSTCHSYNIGCAQLLQILVAANVYEWQSHNISSSSAEHLRERASFCRDIAHASSS